MKTFKFFVFSLFLVSAYVSATSPPTIPTDLTVNTLEIFENCIEVYWSPSTDPDTSVDDYEIHVNGDRYLGTSYTITNTGANTITNISLLGLFPNTQYSIKVRAKDTDGNYSDWSSAVTATTAPDNSPPQPPNMSISFTREDKLTIDIAVPSTDKQSGISHYNIYYGLSSSFTSSATKTLARNTTNTNFIIEDLKGGSYHYVYVEAINGAGLRTVTSVPRQRWFGKAPQQVTGLTLVPGSVSGQGFSMYWSPAVDTVDKRKPFSGIAEYIVYLNSVEHTRVPSPQTNTTITGLQPNRTYEVQVRARDRAHYHSPMSDVLFLRTRVDLSPPTVPTGLVASQITTYGFDVNWAASTDPQSQVSYNVYVDGSLQQTGLTSTSASIRELTENTSYLVEVEAINADNYASLRTPLTVRTKANASPPSTPSSIAFVSNSVSKTSFDIYWSESTDAEDGIARYQVYLDNNLHMEPTTTNLSLTGLIANRTYTIAVRALNGDGVPSALSSQLQVTTGLDYSPPSTPTGLVASSITSGGFQASWTASIDPQSAITKYHVYLNGFFYKTTGGTQMPFAGLTANRTYKVTVKAENEDNLISALSGGLTVNTLSATSPPSAPVLSVNDGSIESSSFDIHWPPSSDLGSGAGITGYEVYINDDFYQRVSSTNTSVTDRFHNTLYKVTVSSINGNGVLSPRSSPLEVTTGADKTPPQTLTGLSYKVTEANISASWNAATDRESGIDHYIVFFAGVRYKTINTKATLSQLKSPARGTFGVFAVNGAGLQSLYPGGRWHSIPTAKAPNAPDGLGVLPGSIWDKGATVYWQPAIDDPSGASGVEKYNVYVDGELNTTVSSTNAAISGLDLGRQHTVTVKSVDRANLESEASSPITITTTPDSSPPSVPTGLTLVPGSITPIGCSLYWNPAVDLQSGVSTYKIYANGVFVATSSNASINLKDISPASTYNLVVEAVNGAGLASLTRSTPVTVTTLPAIAHQDIKEKNGLIYVAKNDTSSDIFLIYTLNSTGGLSEADFLNSLEGRVYTLNGKLVYNQKGKLGHTILSEKKFVIEIKRTTVDKFPSGIYYLYIRTLKGVIDRRLFVVTR